MEKKEKSTMDVVVGIAAIFALCGIGYLIINYGLEAPVYQLPPSPASVNKPIDEHRHDTIRTLPIIEFNSDSVKKHEK
jgi:hypothetical protein